MKWLLIVVFILSYISGIMITKESKFAFGIACLLMVICGYCLRLLFIHLDE